MPGLTYEEFEVGQTIEHAGPHEVTQEDNAHFCRLTKNNQPLHLDEQAAREGPFGKLLVNGIYTFGLAVGVSVEDLTAGTLVANLGYEHVSHPAPVFPGDSLSISSEVLHKRRTRKPDRGLVKLRTEVTNQDGVLVCQFERAVLVRVAKPEEA